MGLIYDCEHISSIDATALQTIKELIDIIKLNKIVIKFSNMKLEMANLLINCKIIKKEDLEFV